MVYPMSVYKLIFLVFIGPSLSPLIFSDSHQAGVVDERVESEISEHVQSVEYLFVYLFGAKPSNIVFFARILEI